MSAADIIKQASDSITDPVTDTNAFNGAGLTSDFDMDSLMSILDKYEFNQYSYNAAQVKEQRKWLEMMANTSYQRAMEDMRRAGINPIVALQSGLHGAEVPSSSAASGSQSNAGSLISAFIKMLVTNSTIQASLFKSLLSMMDFF